LSGNTDVYNKSISILTMYATFLMGFIDAYTYLKYDGVFVSAQTGNVIVMSVKLFSEEWLEATSHIIVFVGFALGAFIGEGIIEKVKSPSFKLLRVFLVIQGILLFTLSLFQIHIPSALMIIALGTLSGYELSIFRRIGITTINNGVMTGNTKNMMQNLYKRLFDRDREAGRHFFNLLSGLVIFIAGVVAGSQVMHWHSHMVLWIAFILNSILMAWLYAIKRQVRLAQ